MQKNNKLGFTLAELLVVIAILAILATVAIIGYTAYIKKANISNDAALVTQLNTVLQANEATDKASTPSEALFQANEAGYNVTKLTPTTAGYNIVWNQDANRFALVDESNKTIAGELNSTACKNWKFADAYLESETFSVYLNDGFSGETVNATAGLDVGNNTDVSVSYKGGTSAQSVIIRMNGGTLTINAPTDTIVCYGQKDSVNITAVSDTSYKECGSVYGSITIAKGRVEIADTAKVNGIVLVTGNDVKVALANNGDVKVAVANDVTNSPIVTGAHGDIDTISIVTTAESFKTVAEGGGNAVLNDDISLEESATVAEGKTLTLYLNGHKISAADTALNVLGSLTIEGSGEISSMGGTVRVTGGTATINGGTYYSTNGSAFWADQSAAITFNNCVVSAQEFCVGATHNSTVTIKNGTFTSRDNAVIGTNGTKGYGGNTITVNGGTFNGFIESSGYIACGVYVANADTVNINGGTFNITNGVGILMRSGTTTIEKNVVINLTNTGDTLSGAVGDSNVTVPTGAALVQDTVSNYPGGDPTCTNYSSYTACELTDGKQ